MSATDSHAINHIKTFISPIDLQDNCPLFCIIPPEVRNKILAYALADYEDTNTPYEDTTCYKRPNYHAPRRSDTAIIRTCQLIYNEAWFRPFSSAEHTFYLARPNRRPARITNIKDMQNSLKEIASVHGAIELEHIRVFAQCYLLEPGAQLDQILTLEHFHPRTITFTIRHTDCWHWESDERLYIRADWVKKCRFPASVTEIRVEYESLERKKDQVNSIASQLASNWIFERVDGDFLLSPSSKAASVMRWKGSSTWEGRRWIRDETSDGILEYYVVTVVFTVKRASSEDVVRFHQRPEESRCNDVFADFDEAHSLENVYPAWISGAYDDRVYDDPEYDDGEHDIGEYDDGEYDDEEYDDGEHDNGEHDNGEHDDAEHDDGEHDDAEHDDGEHDDGEHHDAEHDHGAHDDEE